MKIVAEMTCKTMLILFYNKEINFNNKSSPREPKRDSHRFKLNSVEIVKGFRKLTKT